MLEEDAELASVILGLFAAVSLLSHRHPQAAGFHHRRLGILLLIAAAVVLVQVTEEVIGQVSTAFDRSVLLALHAGVSASLVPAFSAITMSGSSHTLVPAVGVLALALWWRGQRFEAMQLAASMAAAGLVIHVARRRWAVRAPTCGAHGNSGSPVSQWAHAGLVGCRHGDVPGGRAALSAAPPARGGRGVVLGGTGGPVAAGAGRALRISRCFRSARPAGRTDTFVEVRPVVAYRLERIDSSESGLANR